MKYKDYNLIDSKLVDKCNLIVMMAYTMKDHVDERRKQFNGQNGYICYNNTYSNTALKRQVMQLRSELNEMRKILDEYST